MKRNTTVVLPPEWSRQSAIQLTWPHEQTDWYPMMDEVIPCFVSIAKEIAKREKLIIICRNPQQVCGQLGDISLDNILFRKLPSDDTWARDHGAISVWENGAPVLYDFVFNGWGLKFAASEDNRITRRMFRSEVFAPAVAYSNKLDFVLEGGSIESDGEGTLLTTYTCLGSENRNETMDKPSIERYLKDTFGLQQVLWLHHGYLAGDDTDSHVDTLARLCDPQTIAYVSCTDTEDEHYEELRLMEKELKTFRTLNGEPYRLVPLPMAAPVFDAGERLPATYANFLILNDAVLLPYYQTELDEIARVRLKQVFPDREIVGINCLPLIRQHGSLHCVTMQYPEGFVK